MWKSKNEFFVKTTTGAEIAVGLEGVFDFGRDSMYGPEDVDQGGSGFVCSLKLILEDRSSIYHSSVPVLVLNG